MREITEKIGTVALVLLVVLSVSGTGITTGQEAGDAIEIIPGNSVELAPGGTYSIAITTTKRLSKPHMSITLLGNPEAEIEDISTQNKKFNSNSWQRRSANLRSDEAFLTNQTVVLNVRIPESASTEPVKVMVDVYTGGDLSHEAETEYSVVDSNSVSTQEELAEQARARAQIAEEYAKIYDKISNRQKFTKTLRRGLIEGFLTVGIAQTKGYIASKIPGLSTANELKGGYEEATGQGMYAKLGRILDAMIPDYSTRFEVDNVFNSGDTGQALREMASLYREEAEAWEDGDREKALEVIKKERKSLCMRMQTEDVDYRQATDKTCLYHSDLQPQRQAAKGTIVEPYFNGIFDFVLSDFRYVKNDLMKQAKEPNPSVETQRSHERIADNIQSLSTGESLSTEITVKNQKDAGISRRGYLSISNSKNLQITNVEKVSGSQDSFKQVSSKVGDSIVGQDGEQSSAKYPLTDVFEPYQPGESNTYRLTIKRTGSGDAWIAYRTALIAFVDDVQQADFARAPGTGPKDQQGWPVKEIRAAGAETSTTTTTTDTPTSTTTTTETPTEETTTTTTESTTTTTTTTRSTTTTETSTSTTTTIETLTEETTTTTTESTITTETSTETSTSQPSSSERLQPPFNEEFEEGTSGWTVGLPSGIGPRVTEGDGEWSDNYDGSVRLDVDGGPSHIGVYREVGELEEGSRIVVNYESSNLEGKHGGPRLLLHLPESDKSVKIDMDPGSDDPDGKLAGTVPRDLPAGTELEARLGVWPGEITVYITDITVQGAQDEESTTEDEESITEDGYSTTENDDSTTEDDDSTTEDDQSTTTETETSPTTETEKETDGSTTTTDQSDSSTNQPDSTEDENSDSVDRLIRSVEEFTDQVTRILSEINDTLEEINDTLSGLSNIIGNLTSQVNGFLS